MFKQIVNGLSFELPLVRWSSFHVTCLVWNHMVFLFDQFGCQFLQGRVVLSTTSIFLAVASTISCLLYMEQWGRWSRICFWPNSQYGILVFHFFLVAHYRQCRTHLLIPILLIFLWMAADYTPTLTMVQRSWESFNLYMDTPSIKPNETVLIHII